MVVKYPNYNSHWLLTGKGDMVSTCEDNRLEIEKLLKKIEFLEESLKAQKEKVSIDLKK